MSVPALSTNGADDYRPQSTSRRRSDRATMHAVTDLPRRDRRHTDTAPRSDAKDDTTRTFARALGARLREARHQRGLTLQNVEDASAGVFTSVTLSSYERGDRSMSVARLVDLAAFYGMPPAELLPAQGAYASPMTSIVSVDLQQVAQLPPYQASPLLDVARASTIQEGTHFALDGDQLARIARVYGLPTDEVLDLLASWGVLSRVPA